MPSGVRPKLVAIAGIEMPLFRIVFVFPAWFETFPKPRGAQFDFGRHINGAFELAQGADATVLDVSGNPQWQKIQAPPVAPSTRPVKKKGNKP
jgi:hypothetical protein